MMLAVGKQLFQLKRHMRTKPAALRSRRDRMLQQLVRHAYQHVPYYRERFDAMSLSPDSIRSAQDLERLPIIQRGELQDAGPAALTSQAFKPDQITTEKTSGSSGRPFELRIDAHWRATRDAMFLRALMATGYRPGHRMMLLTSGDKRDRGWPMRWRYIAFDRPPAEILEEFNTFRPRLLYGWVTPLRQLAEYIREGGKLLHRPTSIVTTAESLDESTRTLLAETFGAEVFQFYGLTEMGAVAWECRQHHGLHIAEDTIIAEQVDGRLILTNLALYAMPLIRYDSGDLISQPPICEPCGCGTSFRRLHCIEGRRVDNLRLPDGRVLSPYELTLAMEQVIGLARYQLVQYAVDRVQVGYVPADHSSNYDQAIRNVLSHVIGSGVIIEPLRRDSLDPPVGRKFRVVECRL